MRVHLVDGTYELFRAYSGAPSAQAPDGREVGATRGLLRSLGALVRHDGATHVGVAFDHVIESFRNDLLAASLREGREQSRLFRTLATLRTDVPLTESLDDLRWRGPLRDELARLCAELGDSGFPASLPLPR